MKRRRWLQWGCAHCAWMGTGAAWAQRTADPVGDSWLPPARFSRPDLSSDEGGLWALMDREETRLRRSPFRLRDEALSRYLTQLTCQLGGEHCSDVRVYAVRAPHFNASMAPNGMMQVWSGLLLRVENEAQLATVLAHEVGHYLRRHTLEQLQTLRDRAGFGLFLGLFGVVGLIGQLANIAGLMAFSREHEREADRIAMLLLKQRGYDLREAPRIWANLLEELRATPNADPSRNSVLFASHPPSEERRDTLERFAESQGAVAAGHTGEQAFREVVQPLMPMLLEDEIKRDRPHESVALLNRLLSRQAGNPLLLHHRGEALLKRAQPDDRDAALESFNAAVQTGQAPAITFRSLGHLHRQRQETGAARDAWRRYLDQAPHAPDAELIKQQLQELPA